MSKFRSSTLRCASWMLLVTHGCTIGSSSGMPMRSMSVFTRSPAKMRMRSSSSERKNRLEPGSPWRPARPRSWLSMRRDSCRSVPRMCSPRTSAPRRPRPCRRRRASRRARRTPRAPAVGVATRTRGTRASPISSPRPAAEEGMSVPSPGHVLVLTVMAPLPRAGLRDRANASPARWWHAAVEDHACGDLPWLLQQGSAMARLRLFLEAARRHRTQHGAGPTARSGVSRAPPPEPR